MKRKNPCICLVSFVFHEAFIPPINHLEHILTGITDNLYTIYSVLDSISKKNDLQGEIVVHKHHSWMISRIFHYVLLQLKLCFSCARNANNIDCCLLFMESGSFLIIITAKLMGKKVFWMLPSSFEKMLKFNNDPISLLLIPIQKISLLLCDKIIIYSPNLINEWNLQNYQQKILLAHEHFINTEIFTITSPLSARLPLLIGYIGRLSMEKGVLNFIQALPAILNIKKDISVFIGGSGQLKNEIEGFLKAEDLTGDVNLAGWIEHDNLPEYLNKLQLLILPSYTEGLPNILLEAMACGTPVLATSVGSIPDIINDGETGFIMANNSPKCIAENIIRALNCQELEQIADNGRRFVEENFTFEKGVDNWKRILQDVE